jgi:hypothetical protein
MNKGRQSNAWKSYTPGRLKDLPVTYVAEKKKDWY